MNQSVVDYLYTSKAFWGLTAVVGVGAAVFFLRSPITRRRLITADVPRGPLAVFSLHIDPRSFYRVLQFGHDTDKVRGVTMHAIERLALPHRDTLLWLFAMKARQWNTTWSIVSHCWAEPM
jgi:hypothetical protein